MRFIVDADDAYRLLSQRTPSVWTPLVPWCCLARQAVTSLRRDRPSDMNDFEKLATGLLQKHFSEYNLEI